ncbi:hypothetical protein [Rhodoferax saidenbachensis]|uniref:Uncharacterized protein n=1 Tax=Rhodoferax saidenbachensis TaxID=1484693 RepID=A0ABU1ZS64_9BURK|nr:hypothetical protein [Rhodoferax saidenbachensis]MDR7308391.1 hypothetical protein [Rhodoferax saidenbachensis]
MTTTTLHNRPFTPNARPSVGEALRALGVSAQNLVLALWSTATARTAVQAKAHTALDEVSYLRGLADDALAKDPGFAQDLYAMADRMEREALATQVA